MTTFRKMIAGAAFVGASIMLAGAASADTGCGTREVSLYFEKGQTEFNDFSRAVVERVASEAKACGATQIVAEAPDGKLEAKRSAAIRKAFDHAGVKVILVGASLPVKMAAAENVLDRGASVRLVMPGQAVG